MFVQMMSLVQRDVSVLCDGIRVGARLGTSYLSKPRTPATHVSLRPSEHAYFNVETQ